jgi:hypothetical protein
MSRFILFVLVVILVALLGAGCPQSGAQGAIGHGDSQIAQASADTPIIDVDTRSIQGNARFTNADLGTGGAGAGSPELLGLLDELGEVVVTDAWSAGRHRGNKALTGSGIPGDPLAFGYAVEVAPEETGSDFDVRVHAQDRHPDWPDGARNNRWYHFDLFSTGLLLPDGEPHEEDLEECGARVDLAFFDGACNPILPTNGTLHATQGGQAQMGVDRLLGENPIDFALEGGEDLPESYVINATVQACTDPYSDQVTYSYQLPVDMMCGEEKAFDLQPDPTCSGAAACPTDRPQGHGLCPDTNPGNSCVFGTFSLNHPTGTPVALSFNGSDPREHNRTQFLKHGFMNNQRYTDVTVDGLSDTLRSLLESQGLPTDGDFYNFVNVVPEPNGSGLPGQPSSGDNRYRLFGNYGIAFDGRYQYLTVPQTEKIVRVADERPVYLANTFDLALASFQGGLHIEGGAFLDRIHLPTRDAQGIPNEGWDGHLLTNHTAAYAQGGSAGLGRSTINGSYTAYSDRGISGAAPGEEMDLYTGDYEILVGATNIYREGETGPFALWHERDYNWQLSLRIKKPEGSSVGSDSRLVIYERDPAATNPLSALNRKVGPGQMVAQDHELCMGELQVKFIAADDEPTFKNVRVRVENSPVQPFFKSHLLQHNTNIFYGDQWNTQTRSATAPLYLPGGRLDEEAEYDIYASAEVNGASVKLPVKKNVKVLCGETIVVCDNANILIPDDALKAQGCGEVEIVEDTLVMDIAPEGMAVMVRVNGVDHPVCNNMDANTSNNCPSELNLKGMSFPVTDGESTCGRTVEIVVIDENDGECTASQTVDPDFEPAKGDLPGRCYLDDPSLKQDVKDAIDVARVCGADIGVDIADAGTCRVKATANITDVCGRSDSIAFDNIEYDNETLSVTWDSERCDYATWEEAEARLLSGDDLLILGNCGIPVIDVERTGGDCDSRVKVTVTDSCGGGSESVVLEKDLVFAGGGPILDVDPLDPESQSCLTVEEARAHAEATKGVTGCADRDDIVVDVASESSAADICPANLVTLSVMDTCENFAELPLPFREKPEGPITLDRVEGKCWDDVHDAAALAEVLAAETGVSDACGDLTTEIEIGPGDTCVPLIQITFTDECGRWATVEYDDHILDNAAPTFESGPPVAVKVESAKDSPYAPNEATQDFLIASGASPGQAKKGFKCFSIDDLRIDVQDDCPIEIAFDSCEAFDVLKDGTRKPVELGQHPKPACAVVPADITGDEARVCVFLQKPKSNNGQGHGADKNTGTREVDAWVSAEDQCGNVHTGVARTLRMLKDTGL